MHHVIVEGKNDAEILKILLAPEIGTAQRDIMIWEGQGASGAESLACSIVAVRREPVVLVTDTDTLDRRRIAEQRSELEGLLRQYAPEALWRLVLMVPEMEAVLFVDPKLLRGLLRLQPSKVVLERAKYDPKGALQALLGEAKISQEELLTRLRSADLTRVRAVPEVQQLIDFLDHAVSSRRAARFKKTATR